MKTLFSFLILTLLFFGCTHPGKKANAKILTDKNILYRNEKQLTDVIIYDVFSPPVSSRIYAYTSLASYEALRFSKPGYLSIAEKLHGFSTMPVPEKNKAYNFLLAATKAFFTVAEKVTFSKDTLVNYETNVFNDFQLSLDKDIYDRSIAFGESVGNKILERTKVDMYQQTRGMAKFLGSTETGKWRPTPPDYSDAAEPYWSMIMPLAVDSASQISCAKPPDYDTSKTSEFFKNVNEVYTIGKSLTDSQRIIAKYWDDNPFVIEHSGHLMFGNKKVTPVGHWMGITTLACQVKNVDAVEAAKTYVLTSVAMYDVIITCWKEKFRSLVIRPITVINETIDRYWEPFLQTPAFPEHSSGHSGISAAAATILTKRFGNNFSFNDTTEHQYIGMTRSFQSFDQAALEASLSRIYGGIHYRTGVDAGAQQGRDVGNYILNKFFPPSYETKN
ncbi:MAG: vanadium-dependent haloperoxidase [Ginsengibacter sp.]